MKILKPLICAGFWVVLINFFSPQGLAQTRAALPPELSQSSSLLDVLDWLNQNSFPHARIGLKSAVADWSDDLAVGESAAPNGEEFVFSQGFRLEKANGCILVLRNDGIKILKGFLSRYSGGVMEPNPPPHSGLLYIPLDRLSYKGVKAPYRFTRDPDKTKLLGTWRTKFGEKGFFRHGVFEMEIFLPEHKETKEHMYADELTVTFDSKEMAEKFNAAFLQAIRLCRVK